MADEQNKERAEQRDGEEAFRPPSPSADLLDLVRSAEDEARLAIRTRTPSVPMKLASVAPAGEEEFVDVGDEAVDAPPSMPPLHAASPGSALASGGRASRPSAEPSRSLPVSRDDGAARSFPPALGIVLLLAFAVGALLLLTR